LEEYYNEGAKPPIGVGELPGWNARVQAYGFYKNSIQVAISQLHLWDEGDTCQPLIALMASRLNSSVWLGDSQYRHGQWGGEEVDNRRTIYINKVPTYNWDSNGNVIRAGERDEPLRNTAIEEMIHMWFDTDLEDFGGEKGAAMAAMRIACGFHSF
jgi:hypothetical protein